MTDGWVRDRFALAALEYPIPARANRLDFTLGALTLVALTLLAVTGIILTQFYDPTPLDATHDDDEPGRGQRRPFRPHVQQTGQDQP